LPNTKTKFILYACAECIDNKGDVILFAVQSGGNIQKGVMTPVSCPICTYRLPIVALKEFEIDTELGLLSGLD